MKITDRDGNVLCEGTPTELVAWLHQPGNEARLAVHRAWAADMAKAAE